jgi:hypothetical protein
LPWKWFLPPNEWQPIRHEWILGDFSQRISPFGQRPPMRISAWSSSNQFFLETLNRAAFQRELEMLGGYNTRETGKPLT